jgi:hypothetical protein
MSTKLDVDDKVANKDDLLLSMLAPPGKYKGGAQAQGDSGGAKKSVLIEEIGDSTSNQEKNGTSSASSETSILSSLNLNASASKSETTASSGAAASSEAPEGPSMMEMMMAVSQEARDKKKVEKEVEEKKASKVCLQYDYCLDHFENLQFLFPMTNVHF